MKTIEAARDVVQTAQRTFVVSALPIGTAFFIFLESPDGDRETVRFVRAKWVLSGMIAMNDTGPCSRLRVRRTVDRREADGTEEALIEPPQYLEAGDVLECCEDDEWRTLAPVIGIHSPQG